MVIGAFFSEVGIELLTYFSDFDPKLEEIRKELICTEDWCDRDFIVISRRLKNYDYGVEIQKVNLEDLGRFLLGKRPYGRHRPPILTSRTPLRLPKARAVGGRDDGPRVGRQASRFAAS